MSTISGLGSQQYAYAYAGTQGSRHGGRDSGTAAALAEQLFAALDSEGAGSMDAAGFSAALSAKGVAGDSSALFSALDSNSDGSLTAAEFSERFSALTEQLDQVFMAQRLQGGVQNGMQGGMPPPPPPPGDDEGFSESELQSQLQEISGSNDSPRSELISPVLENFSAADTDGNGKVSFAEAMAYQQSSQSAASAGASGTDSTAATQSAAGEQAWVRQLVSLLRAYGVEQGGAPGNQLSVMG